MGHHLEDHGSGSYAENMNADDSDFEGHGASDILGGIESAREDLNA